MDDNATETDSENSTHGVVGAALVDDFDQYLGRVMMSALLIGTVLGLAIGSILYFVCR